MMNFGHRSNPHRIRRETIESIQRYVNDGLPPSGFLEAVLANDLMDACKRGDHESLAALVAITAYVYNHVPINTCGTRDIVRIRIEIGSATRRKASEEVLDALRAELAAAFANRGR